MFTSDKLPFHRMTQSCPFFLKGCPFIQYVPIYSPVPWTPNSWKKFILCYNIYRQHPQRSWCEIDMLYSPKIFIPRKPAVLCFISARGESTETQRRAQDTWCIFRVLFGGTHNVKSVLSVTDSIFTLFSQNETYWLLWNGNLQLCAAIIWLRWLDEFIQ